MSPLGLHGSASRYVGSRFVTAIGGSVAAAVGPLLAALMFAAGPTQMALITGTSMIISIMLRVPVAGVIDRAPDERRIMVLFGLASAVVSAAVPLLWLADVLTFWRFLACMGLSALCTVVLSAAGYRMVNAVTEPGQRTRALGLLHSSQSAGDVIGQSTGGVLVGLAAPPLALLVDTLASVAGVLLLPKTPSRTECRDSDDAPTDAAQPGVGTATTVSVVRSVLAKPSVLTGLLVGLAGSVIEPVVVLYLLRVADLHPSLVGIAIGTGAIGGILGGVAIGPLTERFGHWPSLTLGIVSMALGTVLLLVLGPISGLGFVAGIVFELGTAVGGTITLAGIMGRLQERTDPRRISVTMSVASVSLELIGLGAIAVGAILAELFALDVPLIASLAIYAVVLIGIAIGAWSRHRRRSSP